MAEEERKVMKEFFEASEIDFHSLLNKDFLGLSIKAVSSANPNRNKTWFTKESLIDAIPTVYGKPILGYNKDIMNRKRINIIDFK